MTQQDDEPELPDNATLGELRFRANLKTFRRLDEEMMKSDD